MFEDYQICPYTGLRSFTEEESIYFKGREDDISQATVQLQRNKFLMLTGASGDGKSSLVYAGIIPNARAGFLKSKYTQWCVADFRPERSPFKNLCRALAKQLEIQNAQTVEAELQHGFSALVDLYKNSSRYNDINSVAWQQANESGRAALKRDAANLIILVDQFEEFFTNPENYHRGVPSRDSNLVLNLLLETARLALEEDLPLYIVFTMRSDYIGQCAAFRTLPEYIGFSQFFVPRLNRSQLQQVIEEPAVLNGNKIARRLTERLIQDIAEGVDQLPILQHALNQIWHAANKGADEMDLLHYAMVGGMQADLLPDDQVKQFEKWFNGLPEKIKVCYREPNLQNVLDAHASKLYESAAEGLRSRTGKEISDETAKQVIKVTFTCLTKIDQSRAVRNRMTLREIQQILDRNDVSCEVLGQVLNIFREPGNTFIRPFITEDIESGALREDDVLDITHESLIRNWELLEHWAKEEFNNYTISLDFEQQLNHWVGSNKSSDFLLSMGPLNYFETWHDKVNPNAHWIARYLPEEIQSDKKLLAATVILDNGKEFLKRSARKHLITRTVIKYGPRRIAAALAILGILILSSFGLSEYFERQNSAVLKKIAKESLDLAGNRKIPIQDKSILLCENVKLGINSISTIAKNVEDPLERINTIAGVATALVLQGYDQPEKEIGQSLFVADSLLQLINRSLKTPHYNDVLRESNELMATLERAQYFNPSVKMKSLVQRNARRIAEWLILLAKERPMDFTDIKNFDMALEHAINHSALNEKEIEQLIFYLSPIEQKQINDWVKTKFAADALSERTQFNYAFAFNGLYQELAYCYAALGNSEKALQCIDTLLKYNQKYYANNYAHMPDNAMHIAATFHRYQRLSALDNFVKGYCERKKINEVEFYRTLCMSARMSYVANTRLNFFPWWNRFFNTILMLSDHATQNYFFKKYRTAIRTSSTSKAEKNFYLAVSYKDHAIDRSMLSGFQSKEAGESTTETMFDSAFFYYKSVGKEFLSTAVSVHNNSEAHPISYLFLFPDFNSVNYPGEPRNGYNYYSSTDFLKYILDHQLFDFAYPTDQELSYLEEWFEEYRQTDLDGNGMLRDFMSAKFLRQLELKIRERKKTSKIDFSELYLLLANSHFTSSPDSIRLLYREVNASKAANISGAFGPFGMYQTAIAIVALAGMNDFDEVYRFVRAYKKPANRSALYGFSAQVLAGIKTKPEAVNRLIDSARAEMLRVENSGSDQQGRLQVPYALAMRGHPSDIKEADLIIKNVWGKFFVKRLIARSRAFHGELYEAYHYIPESVSAEDKSAFLWNVLFGFSLGTKNKLADNRWEAYDATHRWWFRRAIFYEDENN